MDADVFVGLSVKGLVTKEMVASMAADPIIFALANPDPEILPEDVAAVRDDAIMATGRSDYPNQINNVLGFPFIFRGALDVRARGINPEMMLAATRALAELAREEVPDTVRGAYEGSEISFGREYLIPKPFDHRVSVARRARRGVDAAMESGVARSSVDLDDYRDRLRASLGPGREVMRWMTRPRRGAGSARVVFPEGHNDRIIRAASTARRGGDLPAGAPRATAQNREKASPARPRPRRRRDHLRRRAGRRAGGVRPTELFERRARRKGLTAIGGGVEPLQADLLRVRACSRPVRWTRSCRVSRPTTRRRSALSAGDRAGHRG